MTEINLDAKKGRDNVLDFWRGVSILLVILHHLVCFRYSHFFKVSAVSALSKIESLAGQSTLFLNKTLIKISEIAGPLGVKIFFVISGYIITKLLLEEEKKDGHINPKGFYFKRVMRILPPLLFYFIFLFLFKALGWIQFTSLNFFNSAGFLCNIHSTECGWHFVHTWSLAIEEQFYILWPLFFLLPLAIARYRTKILTSVLVILLGLSAFGVLTLDGWLDIPLSFACIGFGALFAMSEKFRLLVKRYGLIIIITIALFSILIFFKAYFLRELVHQAYRLIQPFVIIVAIALTYEFRWFIRTKLFLVITKIGLISYSLYLWQQVFLADSIEYLKNSFLILPVFMILFAVFSYLIIEKPVIRWARTVLKKRAEMLESNGNNKIL